MKSAKACPDMDSGELTQFELSKVTLRNLNKFNLKPTAKLVLLSLVDHYPSIYPSQQTIANELGVSLRSVKTAIKELSEQGIIIYQTKGFNTYKLTKAFFGVSTASQKVQKMVPDSAEFAPKEINKEKTKKSNFKNIYTSNVKPFNQKCTNYRSEVHITGPQYQEFKPEIVKAESPLDMTKEQAVEFIENMPLEVRRISTIAKQLQQKWNI